MNTLRDRLGQNTTHARTKHLTNIDLELNNKIVELFENDKKQVVVSVNGIATLAGMHERTVRSIGFPEIYDKEFESCKWKKWKGLIINIEKYLQEIGAEISEKQLKSEDKKRLTK